MGAAYDRICRFSLFTNLAVDGAVLLTTAKVRRLRPTRSRIFAAAIIGAVYAAAMFWAHFPYLYSFGAKVLVSLGMVLLSYGYGGPLHFIRNFGAFYLVNFATLGGVIGLSYLLRSADSPWGGVTYTTDGGLLLEWQMQLGLFAVTFLLSLWLFRSTSETRRKTQSLEQLFWDVEIKIGDGSWAIKALLDTGNRLYDPLTRIPVMIMEASVWKEQLPQGWCDRLKGVGRSTHLRVGCAFLRGLFMEQSTATGTLPHSEWHYPSHAGRKAGCGFVVSGRTSPSSSEPGSYWFRWRNFVIRRYLSRHCPPRHGPCRPLVVGSISTCVTGG